MWTPPPGPGGWSTGPIGVKSEEHWQKSIAADEATMAAMPEQGLSVAQMKASAAAKEKDTSKVSGGVVVKGSGATEGIKALSEKVGLDLYVDDSGHLQVRNAPQKLDKNQGLVIAAIKSSNEMSLTFLREQDSAVPYASTDNRGGHVIDMSDLQALESSGNTSAFTKEGAILHELAEAYAEVTPNLTRLDPHYFANDYSPGLSSIIESAPGPSSGGYNSSWTATQYVQDGSGTKLVTTFGFWPPRPTHRNPLVQPKWELTGPVVSARSIP